jgi:hypothetical protein
MPDTTRDMPLTVAKLIALMSATGTGLYLALGVQPSETAAFLLRVLPLLTIVLWLQRERIVLASAPYSISGCSW